MHTVVDSMGIMAVIGCLEQGSHPVFVVARCTYRALVSVVMYVSVRVLDSQDGRQGQAPVVQHKRNFTDIGTPILNGFLQLNSTAWPENTHTLQRELARAAEENTIQYNVHPFLLPRSRS